MGFEVGAEHSSAINIWNMMGGSIDWPALETLVEYHGVQDVELLIDELIAIRDHMARQGQT